MKLALGRLSMARSRLIHGIFLLLLWLAVSGPRGRGLKNFGVTIKFVIES